MKRFADFEDAFRQLTSDPHWIAKLVLTGVLLINPLLVALAPRYFQPDHPAWVQTIVPWLFVLNVLTFCFPLGFTFEVLRRARTGRGSQLPEWRLDRLGRYGYEGLVKFGLAGGTLLLPVGIWFALVYLVFIRGLGLPSAMLSMFSGPIVWLGIPFCAVACCRWLDGIPAWDCALNYAANWRILRRGCPDFLIAAAVLMGFNAIGNGFFYSIPFATVFGLCFVDLWFGPIYAEVADPRPPATKTG